MEGRERFKYGRQFFYLRAFLLMLLFASLLLILGLQTTTPGSWVAGIATLLFVYLAVVGLSPLLTAHTLLRSRVILRQGWYFRAVIPFSDVESVTPWDGDPKFGLKISLARLILFCVGSATGLVSIRLRTPRRFASVLFVQAREIVFDVDDRDRFLAAVEDRKSAGVPLPAKKVPILPAARR